MMTSLKPFSQLTRLTLLVTTALMSACTNLSGLGGSTSLSCPLDAGGTCQSIRTTYEQVASGQTGAAYVVPSQNQNIYGVNHGAMTLNTTEQAKNALFAWNAPPRISGRDAPTSGQPIRTESDVLRVWIAPYEDDEGVLRDQSYAYVVLDNARWAIEHNQRRIMQIYAPVKAPASATKANESELTPMQQGILPMGNSQQTPQ